MHLPEAEGAWTNLLGILVVYAMILDFRVHVLRAINRRKDEVNERH